MSFFKEMIAKLKPESVHESELEARLAKQLAADSASRTPDPTTSLPTMPDARTLVATPPEIEASVEPEVRSAMDEDNQLQRERAKALRDPLFLANDILGFELQPEHAVLLDSMTDERFRDTLILWPRGSGKTSCIVVTIVRELLRNPNTRVVYATADADLAKRRFAQIADIFRNPTERLRTLFPTAVLAICKGNEFVLAGRTSPAISEPSFFATPIGAVNTGSRYDLLVLDDIVSDANVVSENSRNNNFDRYQVFRGVRSANARLILSGTFYHPDDVYSRICAWAKMEVELTWRIEKHSCWAFKCARCGCKDIFHTRTSCHLCEKAGHSCSQFEIGEESTLIDRVETKSGAVLGWTREGLLREREESRMGLKNFRLQMELDASPESAASWPKFTKELLRSQTVNTANLNLRAAFIVCDLGLRGAVPNATPNPARLVNSTDHDPSVVMAIALHGSQAIPIDCDSGEWGAAELAQRVLGFIQKHSSYQSVPFYSESIGAWPSIRLNIETLAARANVKIDLRDVASSNVENAKLRRIAELHMAMTAGRVGLPAFMSGLGTLCPQLLAYPHQVQGHDDFADCLSVVPLVLDSGIEAVTQTFPQTFGGQDFKPNWSDLQSRIRWNRRNGYSDVGSDSDDGGSGSEGCSVSM